MEQQLIDLYVLQKALLKENSEAKRMSRKSGRK